MNTKQNLSSKELRPRHMRGLLSLQWRHNERDSSTSSRLFTQPFIQTQIKENIKAPRHWPLCGEFTETGEFPAQMASNAENVSIWWRHHVITPLETSVDTTAAVVAYVQSFAPIT